MEFGSQGAVERIQRCYCARMSVAETTSGKVCLANERQVTKLFHETQLA